MDFACLHSIQRKHKTSHLVLICLFSTAVQCKVRGRQTLRPPSVQVPSTSVSPAWRSLPVTWPPSHLRPSGASAVAETPSVTHGHVVFASTLVVIHRLMFHQFIGHDYTYISADMIKRYFFHICFNNNSEAEHTHLICLVNSQSPKACSLYVFMN